MAVQTQVLATDYDIFGRDGEACGRQLNLCLPQTFEQHATSTSVQVIYRHAGTGQFHQESSVEDAALPQILTAAQDSAFRIISVSQAFSYGPLRITKASLGHILEACNIDKVFASVITAFGEPPRISEPGFNCFSSKNQADGSYTISYLHRFVERDNPSAKWSEIGKFRQIGVYHAFSKATNSNLWIFLQPHDYSSFDKRLQMILRRPDSMKTLLETPLRLHEVLVGTYFDNWRWYLKEIAEDFKMESDKVFTADIHKATFSISFDVLQSWRDLADRVIPISALLSALMRILDGLSNIQNVPFSPMADFLTEQKSSLRGVTASTNVLQQRIQGVIDLLANTIDIKNQEDSAKLNTHLYNLTQDTVDDSATVKVITVVTLLYLPASFTGTIFGMNLFVFDQTTRHVVIARDFWIYVAFLVPLTLLTFVVWRILLRRAKQKREKKDEGSELRLRVR